jgi:hypothetical protein
MAWQQFWSKLIGKPPGPETQWGEATEPGPDSENEGSVL